MKALFSLKKLVRPALIAGAVLATQAAVAGPYSSLYFFGDSLSDTGNVTTFTKTPQPTGYQTGSWVNAGGAGVWANTFAASLGLPGNSTASLLGGNNYAWGGGTAVAYTGQTIPTTGQQIGQYLKDSGGTASATGLYTIFVGGNDIAAIIGAATAPGANPTAAIGGGVLAGISAISTQVQTLYAAGARNFLLFNAPDVLPTPRFQGILDSLVDPVTGKPDAAARAGLTFVANSTVTAWNKAFNDAVLSLRAGLIGEDIDTVDVYGYGVSVGANQAAFGFDGSTAPCYTGTGPTCGNPTTRFFWDSFHPNSRAQLQIAGLALNAVPAPAGALLLGLGLVVLAAVRRKS